MKIIEEKVLINDLGNPPYPFKIIRFKMFGKNFELAFMPVNKIDHFTEEQKIKWIRNNVKESWY